VLVASELIVLRFVLPVVTGARLMYKLEHAKHLAQDKDQLHVLTMVTMIANAVHHKK